MGENFRSLRCPRCGKDIAVPRELESFSCVYCGARLDLAALTLEEPLCDPVRLEALAKALSGAISEYPNVFQYLRPKVYPKHFEAYMDSFRELFQELARACPGKENAARLGELTVASLDTWAKETGRSKASVQRLLDECKYTLCLLTVPALRSLGCAAGEDIACALHDAWVKLYPQNTFTPVTYGEITAGFKPRKLCYITTAVCRQAGKADNCPELVRFRAFRDDYLASTPQGQDLIDRYYDLAPGICMAIDLCHRRDVVYPALWESFLRPCYEALGRGDNDACRELYTAMVNLTASAEGLRRLEQTGESQAS